MMLKVSIADQNMKVWDMEQLLHTFPVSTSAFGIGFEEESNKTPTGNFEIIEKIGAGVSIGTIFKYRVSTGKIASQEDGEAVITTRILRLNGLDKENQNTYKRNIYIHGGAMQDEQVGKVPRSHGCVRMRNSDIAALFDLVTIGTKVQINP